MSSFRSFARKRWAVASEISRMRGGFAPWYFLDALHCARRHGASAENYLVLRFFELNERERRTYLTSGRSKELDAALNANASAEDRRTLTNKDEFDRRFAKLNSRAFLPLAEADAGRVLEFLEQHPEVVIKPTRGIQGHGVRKLKPASAEERRRLARESAGRRLLMEEAITQHPVLAEINPTSVNTVRINAMKTAAGVEILGAALRCGGAGAAVDNFHGGAVAYPISAEGVVCGAGRDNRTLKAYMRHPSTGKLMPGLRVPNWERAVEAVKLGMQLVPSMGYVGWDIAITETGAEIIEGNYNWPGGNIIQLDGVGKYPAALRAMGKSL